MVREVFEEACASELAKLTQLLDEFRALSAVSRASITSVELIGGGSRLKIVQNALEEAFEAPLSRTLDAASTVALGTASYVCHVIFTMLFIGLCMIINVYRVLFRLKATLYAL